MNNPPKYRSPLFISCSRYFIAICVVALSGAIGGCAAQRGINQPLSVRLESILNRHAAGGATVSARVMELPSRRILYQTAIDDPRMPASNMKLLTSATGLDVLGPDFTFATDLVGGGSDLYILGTGDPALGDERIAKKYGRNHLGFLDEWVEAVRKRGVTRIKGDLVYNDSFFESLTVHPSWQHDDLVHWYAAPVSALNLNDNCIDITVIPTQPGELVRYEVTPKTQDVVIVNQCVTGEGGSPSVNRMPFADVYVLGGKCNKKRTLQSKPINDPSYFLADALRTRLKEASIEIEGKIRASTDPPSVKPAPRAVQRAAPRVNRFSIPEPLFPVFPKGGSWPSEGATRLASDRYVWLCSSGNVRGVCGSGIGGPIRLASHRTPITDVLWRINQNSQNLFAECLGKAAGQRHDANNAQGKPGSWAGADRAIRGFLDRNDIDHDALVVADCSGLSRDNRVTVRIISDLLAAMFDHPDTKAFRASMARPGGNGTLRSRMKDISDQVYAKTGYIRGVRALSGYVHTKEGKWLCFSIIYNDIPGSVKPFNDLQDEACRLLVNWPNIDIAEDAQDPAGDVASETVATTATLAHRSRQTNRD